MDGDPHIGLLFGAFGVLVGCVGVPVFFGIVFFKLYRARSEISETAAAVRSGNVAELLPWGPMSLNELTREWVGSSTYTAGILGRTDQASGRVPSGRSAEGWLLAFSMDSRSNGAAGLVLATTSAHRLELRITNGVCQAVLNGTALGSFRLADAKVFTAQGDPLGNYWRQVPRGQLALRGHEVATLDTRTQSDTARVAVPTFLITHLLAERSAEDEAWALVAAVMELAWFGPRQVHVQMQGRAGR